MRIIHKALGISLLIHLAIAISLVVLPLVAVKKRYTPVYQVSLVTQPEPKPKKPVVQPQEKKPPEKKPTKVEKKAAPTKKEKKEAKKKEPVKKKDPVKKKEAKKKVAVKKETKKDKEQSLRRVQRRIDEIRKKQVTQQSIEQERLRTSRIVEVRRNAYFDAIAAHIQANWSLLKNQMEDVGILTTDVGLQVRRDGTVTRIVIEKPSGNALFDDFAVRAVKRSTPLPPFPKELTETKLEITIGLSS
jgi:TonB family protein